MLDYETRLAHAQSTHTAGLKRVQNEPPPKVQKFACGSRVRIADDLGYGMQHFPKSKNATVMYTHAHAYISHLIKSYCLHIDGHQGSTSWYEEWQLTSIH